MDLKKQLNKQAIVFSVIMSLSWLTYAAFMIVPEIVDKLNGRMNTLKYAVSEQLCVLVPTVILIVVFLILNYILKPGLGKYFKVHVILGLVATPMAVIPAACGVMVYRMFVVISDFALADEILKNNKAKEAT